MRNRTWMGAALLGSTAIVACASADDLAANGEVEHDTVVSALHATRTRFYVPPPNPGALDQIVGLYQQGEFEKASLIAQMVSTPQAVWFTEGTPEEVQRRVRHTTRQAWLRDRVPVLVAYNLPFRDCAQYSQGGAADTAAYQEWIDGFARGIGKREAIVILEPDGLGIIPNNVTYWGQKEWCQPTVIDEDGSTVPAPGATPEERYAQLRYAIASLSSRAPNARVYLDGSHSHWLGVGEAAYRLYRAGYDGTTRQVQGFFLNASNYESTADAEQFGEWVSMCLALAETGPDASGDGLDDTSPPLGACPSQYRPAEPGSTQYVVDYSDEHVAETTAALQAMLRDAHAGTPTATFVIDTSRNGQSSLDPAPYAQAPYDQPEDVLATLAAGAWCNPPGRGLGLRPTTDTASELVDAYLWIKIPGESDGSCDRNGGARDWDYDAYNPWGVATSEQGSFDPLWGQTDPAAGAWFPAQALELAENANPPLWSKRWR